MNDTPLAKLRLYPIRRALSALLAVGLAPATLYVAVETTQTRNIALGLGIMLLGAAGVLRPMTLPLSLRGNTFERLTEHLKRVEGATIGPKYVVESMQTLGMILGAIAAILTLTATRW